MIIYKSSRSLYRINGTRKASKICDVTPVSLPFSDTESPFAGVFFERPAFSALQHPLPQGFQLFWDFFNADRQKTAVHSASAFRLYSLTFAASQRVMRRSLTLG
jgi:hypothetical protein